MKKQTNKSLEEKLFLKDQVFDHKIANKAFIDIDEYICLR